MKRIFTLLALLTLKLASAGEFTTDFNNGFYWQEFPVRIAVQGRDAQEQALLEQSVTLAVNEWNTEVGFELFEIVAESTNVVVCSSNFESETTFDNSKTLAITERRTSGPYINLARIILNDDHHKICSTGTAKLDRTVLHEFGHIIGLGHSQNPQSIMYYSIGHIDHLTEDDIKTAHSLIATTQHRQNNNFVSRYAAAQSEIENALGSCGTVSLVSNGSGNGPSNGAGSFIISLLMGLIMIAAFKKLPALSPQRLS